MYFRISDIQEIFETDLNLIKEPSQNASSEAPAMPEPPKNGKVFDTVASAKVGTDQGQTSYFGQLRDH
jgi:hypothetical protein